jgi:hypothetical protein
LAALSLMPSSAAIASCGRSYTSRRTTTAQPRRQIRDRQIEVTAQGTELGTGFGVRSGLEVLERLTLVEGIVPVPAAPARVVGGAVRGDPVQPGRELRVAPELLQAAVGAQVRVLDHIARVLFIGDEAQREAVGVAVRDPDQLVEGRAISALRGLDERGERVG